MPRPASPIGPLVLTAFVASLATGALAHAQTQPPPAGSEPPAAAAAPPAAPPAPHSSSPSSPGASDLQAPAPAATPPTAAPLPPPALAPAPPTLATEPGALPPLPPDEPPPIYKQTWFWAVVGVAALTAFMITIGISSQGPKTPGTDLGNMRAY